MKKFTSKAIMAAALITGAGVANAQNIRFETNSLVSASDKEQDATNVLYSTHRSVPLWIDFNNDGLMDIYYCGTSALHGWASVPNLVQNLGGMSFYLENERLWEEYNYTDTDEDGNEVEKTGQREIGSKSGLPKTAYGMGSVAIDYDQDGLTDFIFLNRGGNDTGTERELVLVHNLGDYKFEKVADDALYNVGFKHDNTDSYNEDQEVGTLSVGDYDKDGYPDVLVEGYGSDGRFVKLLHNKQGQGFEEVLPVKPIGLADEINPIGLYKQGEDQYDEDGILIESGAFTDEPTGAFKPMSHGSVAFADFDNDGWLDIVTTGYFDGGTVGGVNYDAGDAIRFYRNLGDGTFKDITDVVAASVNVTLKELQDMWGTEDSGMSVLDFNQDGKVDIFFTGSMHNRSKKVAIVLQNVSDGEKLAFEEISTGILPTSGVTCRLFTVADLNGDDYPDFLLRGWTSYEDLNDWRYSINYSNNSNSYEFEMFNTSEPEEIGGHFCETMSLGDFNGDGLLDICATDWGNMDYTSIHLNKTDAVITTPDAPTNVTAKSDGTSIEVTWDAMTLPNSGNEPLYNLYVKNKTTGKTFTIVPAIEETGKQKSYAAWSSYVLSGGETPSYTFCNLPEGDYTVGVQTVSYSYAASAFATADCTVTTAIHSVSDDVQTPAEYFTVDGRRVNSDAKGVVIVRQGNKVTKVIR